MGVIERIEELEEIDICVAYELNGKKIEYFPSALNDQKKLKPIYRRLKGWKTNITGIKKWNDLPENAKKYISFIEDYCGIKVSSISTSPKREDTILLENPFDL